MINPVPRLMPEPARNAVAAIVAEILGDRVLKARLLAEKRDYYVLEVDTAGQTVVVKLAGPSSSVPLFVPTLAPHMLAANLTKTPVSTILAADDGMRSVPFRYCVQTKMSGDTWFVRRERLVENEVEEALENLANVTAELHSARLNGYRMLATDSILAESLLAALHAHADRILASDVLRGRFHDILDRRSSDFITSPPAGITHEDLHGFNILFSPQIPTSVSAVLDFDKAWIGPVESDIARMELWHGMTSPRSMARYRDRVPEHEGYEARRPIYQLLWCYEFASPTPSHLSTTNEIEARLGLEPLPLFPPSGTKSVA